MAVKKLSFPEILLVIALIAIVGFNIYAMAALYEGAFSYIASVLYAFTALFAIFYIVSGADKMNADYFQWFLFIFTAVELITAVFGSAVFPFNALATIAFGALCVLSFAKDFGKKKSIIFSQIVLVCNAIYLLILLAIMLKLTALETIDTQILMVPSVSMLIFSFTLIYTMNAKYVDKAIRKENEETTEEA